MVVLLPGPNESRTYLLLCLVLQKSKGTALTIAADRGHDEVVRLLLQHGAKVDHQVSTEDPSRHVQSLFR